MGTEIAKSKTKKKKKKADQTQPMSDSRELRWLRNPADRRSETRFLPRSNIEAAVGVSFSAIGAVLTGAGFWGQLLRKAGAHPYSIHLLLGGIALFFVGLYVSSRAVPNVRVGDAGLAIERPKGLERLGWNEVDALTVVSGVLTARGPNHILNIAKSRHPDAFARAILEARSRIPAKMSNVAEQVRPPPNSAGEQIALPPPQLAGLHCKASDRLIAFETDARLCGKCGETYHKLDTPSSCLTCEAKLR